MSQRNHGHVHSNARCNVGMQDTRRLRGETISHYYDSVPTQHYVLQGSSPLLVSALKNIIPALFLTSSPSTPWDGKRGRITTLLFDRARHFFGDFFGWYSGPLILCSLRSPLISSPGSLVFVVSWCPGVLVCWSSGPPVLCSPGLVVLWFFGFFFLILFFCEQFTAKILNATLDLAGLALVGVAAFLGSEVVFGPFQLPSCGVGCWLVWLLSLGSQVVFALFCSLHWGLSWRNLLCFIFCFFIFFVKFSLVSLLFLPYLCVVKFFMRFNAFFFSVVEFFVCLNLLKIEGRGRCNHDLPWFISVQCQWIWRGDFMLQLATLILEIGRW